MSDDVSESDSGVYIFKYAYTEIDPKPNLRAILLVGWLRKLAAG